MNIATDDAALIEVYVDGADSRLLGVLSEVKQMPVKKEEPVAKP